MITVALRVAAVVALCVAGSAQATTNLVVNGDFTNPKTGSGWTQRSSIPGWTSESGDAIEVGNARVYGASCYSATCQLLEVNANRFGSVSQVVTGLVTGAAYKFGWAYAGRNGGGAQRLDVFLNGNLVAQNSSDGRFTGWQDNGLRFIATAPEAKIMFTSANLGGNRSYGNLITNVAVGGVPEPASWAMMITGFGMVGYASRRRKRLALA